MFTYFRSCEIFIAPLGAKEKPSNQENQTKVTWTCGNMHNLQYDVEDYYKHWKTIDLSRYSYDLNESFSNIDILTFLNDDINEGVDKVENVMGNIESSYQTKIKETVEVDMVIDALDIQKGKIENTLDSIQKSLFDGTKAKLVIEKSLEELYENMKYANEKLPVPYDYPIKKSQQLLRNAQAPSNTSSYWHQPFLETPALNVDVQENKNEGKCLEEFLSAVNYKLFSNLDHYILIINTLKCT